MEGRGGGGGGGGGSQDIYRHGYGVKRNEINDSLVIGSRQADVNA